MKMQIKSDEQARTHHEYGAIDWVGMSKIQSCICENGLTLPVELDMQVGLIAGQRGIHMSRLYSLQTSEFLNQNLDPIRIGRLLAQAVKSQEGISERARLRLKYQTYIKTTSLKSEIPGFRSYPLCLQFEGDQNGLLQTQTHFKVLYSSTCPQSAQLSKEAFREIIADPISLQNWYDSNEIYPATPHAQRSEMIVELKSIQNLDVHHWIQKIEACLKTNVQTAVKKADEMEFARLNSENTMFCEDAVRKVAELLRENSEVLGFRLTSEHFESLHPHNAYSQVSFRF